METQSSEPHWVQSNIARIKNLAQRIRELVFIAWNPLRVSFELVVLQYLKNLSVPTLLRGACTYKTEKKNRKEKVIMNSGNNIEESIEGDENFEMLAG